MQNTLEVETVNPKLERIANILRFVGWSSFCVQIALGAASVLMLSSLLQQLLLVHFLAKPNTRNRWDVLSLRERSQFHSFSRFSSKSGAGFLGRMLWLVLCRGVRI